MVLNVCGRDSRGATLQGVLAKRPPAPVRARASRPGRGARGRPWLWQVRRLSLAVSSCRTRADESPHSTLSALSSRAVVRAGRRASTPQPPCASDTSDLLRFITHRYQQTAQSGKSQTQRAPSPRACLRSHIPYMTWSSSRSRFNARSLVLLGRLQGGQRPRTGLSPLLRQR